jgi:hypothetical protein
MSVREYVTAHQEVFSTAALTRYTTGEHYGRLRHRDRDTLVFLLLNSLSSIPRNKMAYHALIISTSANITK